MNPLTENTLDPREHVNPFLEHMLNLGENREQSCSIAETKAINDLATIAYEEHIKSLKVMKYEVIEYEENIHGQNEDTVREFLSDAAILMTDFGEAYSKDELFKVEALNTMVVWLIEGTYIKESDILYKLVIKK